MGLIRPPIRKLEFLALPARRQLPSRFPSPFQPSYLPYLASPSPLSPPFFQPFFPPNRHTRAEKNNGTILEIFRFFRGGGWNEREFRNKGETKPQRRESNRFVSETVGTTLRKGSPLYTSPAKGCVRRSGARSGGTVISCPRNRSSRILRRVSYRPVLEPLALKIEYCRGIPLERRTTIIEAAAKAALADNRGTRRNSNLGDILLARGEADWEEARFVGRRPFFSFIPAAGFLTRLERRRMRRWCVAATGLQKKAEKERVIYRHEARSARITFPSARS